MLAQCHHRGRRNCKETGLSSILKKKSTKIFLIIRVILSMAGATQGVMISHPGHVGTGAPLVRLSKGRHILDWVIFKILFSPQIPSSQVFGGF